jgi:pSer/pThr/pTyr-binding forkhead associated (FHA) protein
MEEGNLIPEINEETGVPDHVYLEVLAGEEKGLTFPINKKTITIGRLPACDIKLTDQYVSKKHCQIVWRQDHFTIIDLGSLNKTIVKEKAYIQKNLKSGNPITLGKTKLRFVWEKEPVLSKESMATADKDDLLDEEGIRSGLVPEAGEEQEPMV